MKEQKEKARKARKTTNYMGARCYRISVHRRWLFTTKFVGYDRLVHDSKGLRCQRAEIEVAEALTDGQRGTVLVEETPFFDGTMGGQQGDVGTIVRRSRSGEFKVEDTIHLQGGKVGHVGVMVKGMLRPAKPLALKVC